MVVKKTSSKAKKTVSSPAKKEMEMKECEKRIENKVKCKFKHGMQCNGTGGCIYFLGFLGALVYYLTTAPSLWDAFLGFFKALLWPAFLTYGLLLFIGA
jgi:hypothetical protein